jgi:hypothetical protein
MTTTNFNKLNSLTMLGDFINNIETYTADTLLEYSLGPEEKYIRLQVYTKAVLDSYQPDDVAQMLVEGKRMWEEPLEPATQDQFKKMLRDIIDERLS